MEENRIAVLLEVLKAQFRTLEDGLQMLNDKLDNSFKALNNNMAKLKARIDRLETSNRLDHQQIIQAVKDLKCENNMS